MDTIIIITYKSGTREARFYQDAELLDLILDGFDYIAEIEQIEFTGTLPVINQDKDIQPHLIDERTIRNTVRKIGKVATKRLME